MSDGLGPDMREFITAMGEILISAVRLAGVDEETAKQAAQPKFMEIMSNAVDSGEQIGTLWATGRNPKTKAAKEAIALINSNLADKYDEGVRDEDIVDWWNMSEAARQVLFEQFNMTRLGMFIFVAQNYGDEFKDAGEIAQFVAGRARGVTPFFTIAPNPGNAGNPDRGLPLELIPRVSKWMTDFVPPGYDVPIDEIPNVNALIRKDIAAGVA